MLIELRIKDFAIISELSLNFSEGMTALTGETGAGKSIIIDAVGLLLGSRGSSDYLRKGASKCTLEGLFSLPEQPEFFAFCEEIGLSLEEEGLIVQREIYQNGKNICRVNGHLMTINLLKQLGLFLVDIQGQHDHQELLQADKHLNLLDDFSKKEIAPSLLAYEQAYEEYKGLEKKVKKIRENEKAFAQRIDMLHFQVEEIEEAHLLPNEEEELLLEKAQLSNFQKIVETLGETYQNLNMEPAVLDRLGNAMEAMGDISEFHSNYEELTSNLSNAYYAVQEALGQINHEMDNLEWDEERFLFVQERLELIYQLKRKYGETIPSILTYLANIKEELAQSQVTDPKKMTEALEKSYELLLKEGKNLQKLREKAARKLEKEIKQELKDLYMEHTEFKVKFVDLLDNFTEQGLYSGEFYIQTNLGEDLKPLVKVASGGELSRLLLALKSIFSKNFGVTSIIFDEVDAGVSGRVAQAIAQKIHKISHRSQVLCITHLPQVAALADQQYLIEKNIVGKRTETTVTVLHGENRVEAIAKMFTGDNVTPLSMEHARELLESK